MCKTCTPSASISQQSQPTPQQRIERNAKRSKKFSSARAKNLRYYIDVNNYTNAISEDDSVRPYLESYRKRLITCASNSLYRKVNGGRECSLITGLVCNHRLCTVCNMLRSRKLRKKWGKFLQDDTPDVPVRKTQAHFFGADYGDMKEREIPDSERVFVSGSQLLQMFDLMHLTLTVPHEGGKWNGKEYYAEELLKKFNIMRKAEWWTENVFGGEYTVETTYSEENGLHIHIHALLFVDKNLRRSRNYLHHMIAARWNALTINADNSESVEITPDGFVKKKHVVLDTERMEGAKKSFAYLLKEYGEDYYNNFLLDLDGRGSTMTGLKNLYYEVPAAEAGNYKNYFTEHGKTFVYCRRPRPGEAPTSILKGVMECLKYHFEPCAMEKDGEIDMPLVAKVLPNIYRQRLYGKFGGFYGVTALNVLEEPLSEKDLLEETADNASEAFDPRTGLEIDKTEYMYCIADAGAISYDADKPLCYINEAKIKKRISPHDAGSIGHAVKALVYYGYGIET